MNATIKISLPDTGDHEFYRQLGHIVFKMEQVKDDDLIKKTLNDSLKNQTPEHQEATRLTTLNDFNNKAEI